MSLNFMRNLFYHNKSALSRVFVNFVLIFGRFFVKNPVFIFCIGKMPLRCAAMKKKSRVTAFFGGNMIDNATFLCYT